MKPTKRRVFLRAPGSGDAAAFLAAVRRSRALHRGWVSPPDNVAKYRRYLKRGTPAEHRRFLVARKDSEEFVGVISINHIIRGVLKSAFVGYYAFSGHTHQGLMSEGMRLVLQYAFGKLRLHRLEANVQPENRASITLVRKCGFIREGYSRRYLKVAGRWRDHERWVILAEDFKTLMKNGNT